MNFRQIDCSNQNNQDKLKNKILKKNSVENSMITVMFCIIWACFLSYSIPQTALDRLFNFEKIFSQLLNI